MTTLRSYAAHRKRPDAARIEAQIAAIDANPPPCLRESVCKCEVCVRYLALHEALVAAVRTGGGK